MSNFTTRKLFLMPSFDIPLKEQEKIDRFLLLLDKSGKVNKKSGKSVNEKNKNSYKYKRKKRTVKEN